MPSFDMFFKRFIGKEVSIILSFSRVVKGKLLGVNDEVGIMVETPKEYVYLNSEGIVIEGFTVKKIHRKRKGIKKDVKLKPKS